VVNKHLKFDVLKLKEDIEEARHQAHELGWSLDKINDALTLSLLDYSDFKTLDKDILELKKGVYLNSPNTQYRVEEKKKKKKRRRACLTGTPSKSV
jgi:hypothetical protein